MAETRVSFADTAVPRPLLWVMGGIALAVVAILLGITVRDYDEVQAFFDENGPIELIQAFCLAGTALIFAAAFLKSAGARALFCVVAFGAIVTATTRETPRCGSVFYDGGMCLTHTGKDTIVIAGAVLCLLALLWRRLDWRKVLHPVSLRWVWPSFIVMALLAGAEYSEHAMHEELEESLELAAYLYLAAFGVWFLRAAPPAPVALRASTMTAGQRPSR